ncbi:MAG: hypothetical protein ACE5JH_07765 [Acidobacteriota bacterium]
MTVSTISTTDAGHGPAPRGPGARRPRLLAGGIALAMACGVAATPVGAAPRPASPAEVRRILDRAVRALDKASDATRGKDPGRVSGHLRRADEYLESFGTRSGLPDFKAAFDAALRAAQSGDLPAADGALRRARTLLPALADFAVTRQAEVESRAALSAAAAGDGPGCAEALRRFEEAILHDVLIARLDQARQAIARARAAMVRRDMRAGREEVAAARRAVGGLRYAGALSRALFSMRLGTELFDGGARRAARERIQTALQEMQTAIDLAPESRRDGLEQARERARQVWRRMGRPEEGDPEILRTVTRLLERTRREQG